jgi:hypothetical protein
MAVYIALALIMFFFLSFKIMKNFDVWQNKIGIFVWPVAVIMLTAGVVYWPLTSVLLMLMFIADIKQPAVQHESQRS